VNPKPQSCPVCRVLGSPRAPRKAHRDYQTHLAQRAIIDAWLEAVQDNPNIPNK